MIPFVSGDEIPSPPGSESNMTEESSPEQSKVSDDMSHFEIEQLNIQTVDSNISEPTMTSPIEITSNTGGRRSREGSRSSRDDQQRAQSVEGRWSGGARLLVNQKLPKQTRVLLTMIFHDDGTANMTEIAREELLREARKDIPANSPGKGWTKSRDIRNIDKKFSDAWSPTIVVRRGAVLFNLDPIRAIVLRDKCFVFIPEGADSILSVLIQRLGVLSIDEAGNKILFEFRAYEALFATVANILRRELADLEPKVEDVLANLVVGSTKTTLETLRQSKNKVAKMLNRVEGIQRAFTEILDSDPSMSQMNLTYFKKHPEKFEDSVIDDVSHEDAEFLLEAYLQQVDGILNQLRLLTQNIDSVESMVMLRLDYARNYLMRIDLVLSSLSTVCAVSAVVVGAFGMNLLSGLEGERTWFLGVTIFVFIGGFVTCLGFLLYLYRKGFLIN